MICQFDKLGVSAFNGSNLRGTKFGEIRLSIVSLLQALLPKAFVDLHEHRI